MAILEVNNVKKVYTTRFGGNQVQALTDVSFSVEKGEIVGLLGPNGAGKTTTLKMLSGILYPTSGKVSVDGFVPWERKNEFKRRFSIVMGQKNQLWWDLPLSETYTVLKEIYGVSDGDYAERMNIFEDVLGLGEFMHSTVRTLSLGQRMRADLAAALLHNPKVLFLDEPTIGLDVVVKDKIRLAIREINKTYHTTVILTTHDLNDIEELCRRIIIIDAGKKIYDSTLSQLKKDYGFRCSISFEWKEMPDETQSRMLQEMGGNIVFQELDKGAKVSFSKKEVSVAQVIGKVMGIVEVKDIQIKETELTDIVKDIYQNNAGIEV